MHSFVLTPLCVLRPSFALLPRATHPTPCAPALSPVHPAGQGPAAARAAGGVQGVRLPAGQRRRGWVVAAGKSSWETCYFEPALLFRMHVLCAGWPALPTVSQPCALTITPTVCHAAGEGGALARFVPDAAERGRVLEAVAHECAASAQVSRLGSRPWGRGVPSTPHAGLHAHMASCQPSARPCWLPTHAPACPLNPFLSLPLPTLCSWRRRLSCSCLRGGPARRCAFWPSGCQTRWRVPPQTPAEVGAQGGRA